MGETNFNKCQCVRALRKLGFFENSKRRGIHEKWFPPQNIASNLQPQQLLFIMVPHHNELHVQREILKDWKQWVAES